MADVEVKELTQQELSAILYGGSDQPAAPTKVDKPEEKVVEEKVEDTKKDDKKPEPKTPVDTNFNWTDLEKSLEKDKDANDESKVNTDLPNKTPDNKESPKPGRKVTDLLSVVNELIEEKLLFEFEDGAPKTIEEAKELIRLNLDQKEKTTDDQVWERKLSSYSPQIQAIIEYADKGGTDVSPLITAISEIERTGDFDVEKEKDQEDIIKEYLKISGWDESDIKEEIETAKDLGKLKQKAEKFFPKLNQMNQERIQMIMEEQRQVQEQVEATRKEYLKNLKNNLDKPKIGEIKLERSDRASLWDALTNIKYTSWNGQPTNGFFKKIEELQTAKDGNYEHFLEIVHLATNREAFIEKIREEIKTEQASETARKLKIEQTRKASTETSVGDERETKNTIRRAFKNPWG